MTTREEELLKETKNMLGHEAESRIYISGPMSGPIGIKTVPSQEPRLLQYDRLINRARSIFIDRNRIYKDTFVFLGILGTVMTLIGDVFRLRNMIVQNPDHGRQYRDQIEDKLIDVINQAVISLMMIEEENYEGK